MFNSLLPIASSLSFSKIIGGISKTLTVANQLIPLYVKAKPIISNAKNTLGVLREMTSKIANINKPSEDNINNVKVENNIISTIESSKKEDNKPIFFL